MMQTMQMIKTHPDVQGSDSEALIRAIEECFSCAQICISCADACVAEENASDLKQCIRLNMDCADICVTTGRLATRRTGSNEELLAQMLELCAMACRICAEACRSCEQACRQALPDVH
jgi:hypothetical protein